MQADRTPETPPSSAAPAEDAAPFDPELSASIDDARVIWSPSRRIETANCAATASRASSRSQGFTAASPT